MDNPIEQTPTTGFNEPGFGNTLQNLSADMKILGIFLIIYGALTSLSIIGALIGIPLIFSGIRLRDSSNHFDGFNRDKNISTLHMALIDQARSFNILKILIIVLLVLTILYVLLMILFMGTMISQMNYIHV